MRFWRVFCAACLCVSALSSTRAQEPKEIPEYKGIILGQNTYRNPKLGITIELPGEWHFFDREMYSSAEAKQREREMADRARATCKGALCGPPEIDVALQSPSAPPPVYAIFLTAFRLSGEHQNRERYPLKGFAETMSSGSLGNNWVPEGELTAIRLGGKPAYRLIVHHKVTTTAKGFVYVADSNGHVFMLLGTAISEPEKLQSALEKMSFTNATP
jgi:hypothetical protein